MVAYVLSCLPRTDRLCGAGLDHVGEVASRLGEPPIAEDEERERERSEVQKTTPVGRRAFEQDAAIVADERRERVQTNERLITRGHDRLWIDDRRQKHPRDEHEAKRLSRVAQEYAQRSDEPRRAERRQDLRHAEHGPPRKRPVPFPMNDKGGDE